jgi:hypothetical protein
MIQLYALPTGNSLNNLSQAMIFGPLIGFAFQHKLIKETKVIGSFSIDVCAILIFANILRIFFWYYFITIYFRFGKNFETPLLI